MTRLLLALALCAATVVLANDHILNGNGVYVKIHGEASHPQRLIVFSHAGQSGKFTVARTPDIEDDPDAIDIRFVDVAELDADGEPVGKSGPDKHTFNNFASQDFVFSAVTSGRYQGIGCQQLTFTADQLLAPNTSFAVTLLVFNESGTVTNDDETLSVEENDVKFNIEISNWPFCEEGGSGYNLCTQGGQEQVGAYLQMSIRMNGTHNDDSTEDADLILSYKVFADGNWTDMQAPFPTTEYQGHEEITTVRFSKFSSSVFYDPVLRLQEPTYSTSGGGGGAIILVSLLLAVGVIFLVIYLYRRHDNQRKYAQTQGLDTAGWDANVNN